MILRHLRWMLHAPEDVPELDCSKGEMRFACAVIALCVILMVGG